MIKVVKQNIGETSIKHDLLPNLGSEDFFAYLYKAPGCYYMQGIYDIAKGDYDCHANNFDYNDRCLASGILINWKLIEDRL